VNAEVVRAVNRVLAAACAWRVVADDAHDLVAHLDAFLALADAVDGYLAVRSPVDAERDAFLAALPTRAPVRTAEPPPPCTCTLNSSCPNHRAR